MKLPGPEIHGTHEPTTDEIPNS